MLKTYPIRDDVSNNTLENILKLKLFLKDRKPWFLIPLLVVIIVNGIIIWLFVSNRTISEKEHNTVMTRVEFLTADRNLEEIEEILLVHLEKNLDQDQRSQSTLAMANNYMNQKKYETAYEWYKVYERLVPDLNSSGFTALSMAESALKSGNRQDAIKYLEITIEYAPIDPDPFNDLYVPGYKRALEDLKNNRTPSVTEYRLR